MVGVNVVDPNIRRNGEHLNTQTERTAAAEERFKQHGREKACNDPLYSRVENKEVVEKEYMRDCRVHIHGGGEEN
ncbi:MAG: hypothetical protein QXH32_08320 [Candidatus Caldarchaeum sp.]